MTMTMNRDSIVSVTDLVKNFANIRKQAKEGLNMIVFKNNKPDLAILDIDEYESLLKIVEQWENLKILEMIEERYKNDDGTRYTTEEIISMRTMKKQRLVKKEFLKNS